MRLRYFLILGLAVIGVAGPGAADAQPRPAAGDCETLSEAYGPAKLWWGRFSGGRKARTSFFRDGGVEYHATEACFVRRQDCEAWLYRLRSDWQYMPRWSECLRGYRGD